MITNIVKFIHLNICQFSLLTDGILCFLSACLLIQSFQPWSTCIHMVDLETKELKRMEATSLKIEARTR